MLSSFVIIILVPCIKNKTKQKIVQPPNEEGVTIWIEKCSTIVPRYSLVFITFIPISTILSLFQLCYFDFVFVLNIMQELGGNLFLRYLYISIVNKCKLSYK